MDMPKGLQNLKQMQVTTRERLRLILRHSIITDTILRAMGEVIVATMAMARGLLNLKLMQRPILRPSIIMAIIPRVMGEFTVIITPQSMGMGLPMAMARGMPRQKLKPSIPTTMDIMPSMAMVFRRAMVFGRAMVFRKVLAMVFRRAIVLHM